MLAGELGGLLVLAGQQGAEAGIHTLDVVMGDRVVNTELICAENVVDVGLAGRGCARSRFQSVSVVPMIHRVPHGTTKSTRTVSAG
jgi:hypothetical protein